MSREEIIVRYMEIFGGTLEEAQSKITGEVVDNIHSKCNEIMNEYLHFEL